MTDRDPFDTIREALSASAHDLDPGDTAIDDYHSSACRRCAALAALDELREQLRQAEQENRQLLQALENVVRRDPDVLADAEEPR